LFFISILLVAELGLFVVIPRYRKLAGSTNQFKQRVYQLTTHVGID